MMSNAHGLEERIQIFIFFSPVGLHGYNLPIEEPFNQILKISEFLEDFRSKL
jgi:hypothetical protein